MAAGNSVAVSARSLTLLRVSIGIIYVWFGMLKFFHGFSPAEELAVNTIQKLSFHLIPGPVCLFLLASWETALGLLLILGYKTRALLIAMAIHMVCTFTPLLFFPDVSFKYAPYGFTLVGQYIMKNVIILAAAGVLWQQDGFRPVASRTS